MNKNNLTPFEESINTYVGYDSVIKLLLSYDNVIVNPDVIFNLI